VPFPRNWLEELVKLDAFKVVRLAEGRSVTFFPKDTSEKNDRCYEALERTGLLDEVC